MELGLQNRNFISEKILVPPHLGWVKFFLLGAGIFINLLEIQLRGD
jgi:hypothetical protein